MAAEKTFTGDYDPIAGDLYRGLYPENTRKELTREEVVDRWYTASSD